MWRSSIFMLLGLAALFMAPQITLAETAEQAFSRGETALAQGDFRAALRAYADAARADRENKEYLQRFLVVRRVINLRQHLAKEVDAKRWEYVARALHNFYSSNKIHSELLAIDTQLHLRLGSASTACLLADTQLSMKLNDEAVKTLADLPAEHATASTQSLLAIALTRKGRSAEARRIMKRLEIPDEARPPLLYSVARAYAAVQNEEAALATLKRCFEGVAPSVLGGFKERAQECVEFTSLAATDAFEDVLKTESKVHESKCSSGKSCAGCPMRGQCPGSKR
jgi:hypothetical protein